MGNPAKSVRLAGAMALLVPLAACQPGGPGATTPSSRPVTAVQAELPQAYPENARPISRGFDETGSGGSESVAGSPTLRGVDIFAPKRTPALAVDYVEVMRTGYVKDCGNMARLRSSRTDMAYFYCHLNRIDVRPGDTARPGEVIGLIGTSGEGVPDDQPRLRLVTWRTDTPSRTIDPLPPESFLFGRLDGRAICPDPDKIGKDPWEGGYSFGRAHKAREDGTAVLFYPVCDLPQATTVASRAAPDSDSSTIRLSPRIQAFFETYLTKPNPGAFAVSLNGHAAAYNHCSYAVACSQRDRTERDAVTRCQGTSGGTPCRIYAWRGKKIQ